MMMRGRGALALLLVLASCKPQALPPAAHADAGSAAQAPVDEGPVPSSWPYDLDAPPVRAEKAMVASDSPEATAVGVRILARGGNAADAAVATLFALAVAFPEAGSLGGGGFAVIAGGAAKPAALDFREIAPAAVTREMYLQAPQGASLTGGLASGVPGVVMGAWQLHAKYGSRPWAELVAPAIELARDGFTVREDQMSRLQRESPRLASYAGSAALFTPGGKPLEAGTRLENPDLARTLERIARDGPRAFYAGETARLIVEEMKRSGGIISAADLKSYRALWREPVVAEYRGHKLYSMPPPSSGGIAIGMLANLMSGFAEVPWHSPQHLHLLAESMKRVFADRNALIGDPAFVKIDVERLLSKEYADARRATIRPDRATPSAEVKPGLPPPGEGTETTHFSVVDASGMAVALTTTINLNYGSAVTVSGAGFLMNDEMDDFSSLRPGGNEFGLVQGEQNAVQPGKRPLSSMAPTVVLGPDGRVTLVTGARGGGRIITVVFQIIDNVLSYQMGVFRAVASPRIHHQHLPDKLFYEPNGLTEAQIRALTSMGHDVMEYPARERGHTAATIVRAPDGKGWTGTHDPRRQGLAAGI